MEKINALLKELEQVNAKRALISDENSLEMDIYDQWANDIYVELLATNKVAILNEPWTDCPDDNDAVYEAWYKDQYDPQIIVEYKPSVVRAILNYRRNGEVIIEASTEEEALKKLLDVEKIIIAK